jgi:hypothetical protein
VRTAIDVRERMAELLEKWQKRGHPLGFGAGIAMGHATLGRIGFEGRYHYGRLRRRRAACVSPSCGRLSWRDDQAAVKSRYQFRR